MQKAFDDLWRKYPKKLGKKQAFRSFKSTVKNQQDYNEIERALENYLAYTKDTEFQYIQHGSTWFNNWEDWVDFEVPKSKQEREDEIRQSIFRSKRLSSQASTGNATGVEDL